MKNTNLLNIALVIVITSLTSTYAAADVNDGINTDKVALTFKSLDNNKDGYISVEEVNTTNNQALKEAFAKIDTNKDDLLSPSEFEQVIK